MPDNPKPQSAQPEAKPSAAAGSTTGAADARLTLERVPGGLDRIRDILFGEILNDLDKRLARIDHSLASRSSELAQDARRRTDVLETHVRKELEAQSTKTSHDVGEVSSALRSSRQEHREALTQIEQRLARLDERIEAAISRVERDVRQQLLDQAKSFQDELARMRNELRWELVRELGIEPEPHEQGNERGAGPWAAHH